MSAHIDLQDAIDNLRDALAKLSEPADMSTAIAHVGSYAGKCGYARACIENALGCLRAPDPREPECHDPEGVCPECVERESECVCEPLPPRSQCNAWQDRDADAAGQPMYGEL